MAKKQTKTPTTTLAAMKKDNAILRDLVDRREKEIMAMVKTDAWQHKRIETLESEVRLNKNLDVVIDKRIKSLEEQLATASSTLEHEREALEQTLYAVRCDNALLRQKHAAALEFIRAHCFESN